MKNNLVLWVKTWENASQALEKINRIEYCSNNSRMAIESLDLIFKASIRKGRLSEYSGLIEQQKLFSRIKR